MPENHSDESNLIPPKLNMKYLSSYFIFQQLDAGGSSAAVTINTGVTVGELSALSFFLCP